MANGIVLNIDTTKSEFQNPMVQLRQGDGNYQSLAVTVTSNGEPFDLTGWTITFMGTTAGGFKIIDSAVTVTNALQGSLTYTPTKAWGQDQGEFKNAYFKFTKSDETASGASFRVNVLEAVDLTAEEAGDYISVVDVMIDKIKTDMDNKLADTQTTLTNTQNQANTVQSNVNDLNTNVNELKAQNNNIRTSDNTWTGTNKFTKQIDGSLQTRKATFTDFSQVAADMNTYAGQWRNGSTTIANSPIDGLLYYIVEVIPELFGSAGIIRVIKYSSGDYYYNAVNGGALTGWHKIAQDETVIHNTGTETIVGDKKFTGKASFTKQITGSFLSRQATFTDFYQVAADMNTYAGQWRVGSTPISNSPIDGLLYYAVEVIPDITGGAGTIRVSRNTTSEVYYISVSSGILNANGWRMIADNGMVVHNTGTETITGDKTFRSGNYGLRVTSSGVQKTSDNGVTWTNI